MPRRSATTRKSMNGEVVERLLRASARLDRGVDVKLIAAQLDAPYSTMTAHLRRLERDGTMRPHLVVNPFKTAFCNEYRIEMRVDGQQLKARHAARKRRGSAGNATTLQESLVHEIVAAIAGDARTRDHVIVTDAVFVHGSQSRDIDLHVLTNDGIFSIGHYVRDVLQLHPCIKRVTTLTVGWRYCFNGYSGQHVHSNGSSGQ